MQPDPTILAFDTSAAHCAAALLSGRRIIASAREEMGRGQAERLMGFLEELLEAAGLSWRDLDAIGVGTGPGNFTGIRISVATARGLALGLGIPAIGVDGFEARAFGADRPLTCLIPAPRGQIYRQDIFDEGASHPVIDDATSVQGSRVIRDIGIEAMVQNTAHIAAARLGKTNPRPAPLYVRPADAAPPKQDAPVILE